MSAAQLTGVFCAGSYFAGSIPSGLILGRLFTGKDVRESGSGNIGAANVSRVAGYPVAMLVLLLDAAKGVIPLLLARHLGVDSTGLAVVAGVAVLGHDFSIFLRFHGGKGVATTFGVALALAPLPGIAAILVWLIMLGVGRYSSLSSICALLSLPVWMAVFDQPTPYVVLAFALAVLGVITHRENITRLSHGQENRIGRKKL